MAQNRSGIKTKNNIFEVCKKLFYEKGYEETTIQDISEAAGIVPSVVIYHYKSKENIYKAIFLNRSSKHSEFIRQYIAEDESASYIIEMLNAYINFYCAYHDERLRKFFSCYNYDILSPEEFSESYIKKYNQIILPQKNNKYNQLNMVATYAADSYVYKYVFQNFEECFKKFTFQELTEYNIRLNLSYFSIDKDKLDAAFRKSNEILNIIDWNLVDTSL